MPDQIRRYGIFYMSFDVGFEAPSIRPSAHIGPVPEVGGKMIRPLAPGREFTRAEATGRLDLVRRALPAIHVRLKLTIVH